MTVAAKDECKIEDDVHCERMIPGLRPEAGARRATIHPFLRKSPRKGLWRCFSARNILLSQLQHKVVIVGANATGYSIARALREDAGTQICGFVDDRPGKNPDILGRVEDLPWLARCEFIDEVIVAVPSDSSPAALACEIAQRNHLDLKTAVALPRGAWPNAGVERIGKIPVVTLHRESFPLTKLRFKRVFDMLGALFGLIVTSPVMALIALLIRLDSQGPVIYAAERIGVKGKRFLCYKFRSMAVGADRLQEALRCRNQRQGAIFKIENDPRVTRVGRIIRRYSLDELPQLWNVWRGDMSLVGPRPHPVEDVNRYEVNDYRRLDVKPGLTGLWQVTARKDPSFRLSMSLDLSYIENWSLVLDLRILLRTVRCLVLPDGM